MIVPFPAGGGGVAVARIVADKLGAAVGQQIVIDNRGGAAGVIGMRVGAKAAPDGYTLIIAHTGTTSINPSLYQQPGYDPRRDFAPIGLISSTPIVLMAHPAFPAKSLAELIALAKKEPGKLNFASVGIGSYPHLDMERLMKGAIAPELTSTTCVLPATVSCNAGATPLYGTWRSRIPVAMFRAWLIIPPKVLAPSLAAASFPGCDLSSAISSASDFAGTELLTATTMGDFPMSATGTKSRSGS